MSIQQNHTSIEDNFRKWSLGIYWAYIGSLVLSFFSFGFALPLSILIWLGSLMVAFNQRKSSEGTIYQSHFQNYITVFWVSIIFFPAAGVLVAILAGVSLLAVGDGAIGGGTIGAILGGSLGVAGKIVGVGVALNGGIVLAGVGAVVGFLGVKAFKKDKDKDKNNEEKNMDK